MWIIKIGGNASVQLDPILDDLKTWASDGKSWVLVHGFSGWADRLGEELGHPPRHVLSVSGRVSRYTDRRTLDIILMAGGLYNAMIVSGLVARGVNAVGIRGFDGVLVQAVRKPFIKIRENGRTFLLRDDYTGRIDTLHLDLLHLYVHNGYFPVVMPVGISREGLPVNLDGDRLACELAIALSARGLIYLTGAPGILRAFPDESSRLDVLTPQDWPTMKHHIRGRMQTKVETAIRAVTHGIPFVMIADGRKDHPLTRALNGDGTRILAEFLPLSTDGGHKHELHAD